LVVTVAVADDVHSPVRKSINIPAQELAPALQALARDRDFQVVYVSEELSGHGTAGAVGELTSQEALTRLLQGTGFTFKDLDDKTVTIVPATQPAPQSRPQAEIESTPLPQVTVEAQRQALEHRVFHFVSLITGQPGTYQSLARWNRKICPAVAGLTRERGELVLQRISTIARAAGAPLAPEKCDPNLFVLFTPDPAQLIEGLIAHNASRLLGLSGRRADGGALRQFAAGTQPVRAWYNAELKGARGNELHAFDQADLGGRRPLENDHPIMSRIQVDDVQDLTSVLVIVDTRRIDGLKIGAVADYAAMLGLARINVNADVTGMDSVLRLFAVSADVAATISQLGAWDAAFLKALYGTEQANKMQRTAIVNSMLRDTAVAPRE
jgi:hypothetical protein